MAWERSDTAEITFSSGPIATEPNAITKGLIYEPSLPSYMTKTLVRSVHYDQLSSSDTASAALSSKRFDSFISLFQKISDVEFEQALVSAKLHEEDYPCVIRCVAGIIFLGTPHRGSNSQSKASVIASIASAVSCGEHSSLLKAVEKDSEMLADLLHDFTRTVITISIPLFCFFEQHKSDVAKILKFRGSKVLMPSVKVE